MQGYPTAPVDSIKRAYAHLAASGQIKFLLQIGGKASADYPHTPFILDFAQTPEERKLIDVSLGSLKIGYPYFMAEKVPAERVAAGLRARMKAGERLSGAQLAMLRSCETRGTYTTEPGQFCAIPPDCLPPAMRQEARA